MPTPDKYHKIAEAYYRLACEAKTGPSSIVRSCKKLPRSRLARMFVKGAEAGAGGPSSGPGGALRVIRAHLASTPGSLRVRRARLRDSCRLCAVRQLQWHGKQGGPPLCGAPSGSTAACGASGRSRSDELNKVVRTSRRNACTNLGESARIASCQRSSNKN